MQVRREEFLPCDLFGLFKWPPSEQADSVLVIIM